MLGSRILKSAPPADEETLGNGFERSKGGIILRRFAGHLDHAERLTRPLRVAHLTDQHVGRITPYRVQLAAIEAVNRERPDVVTITGDFVAHSLLFLDELQDVIERIEAPVFAVLGNHDYWSGAEAVRHALKRAGAEILDNANTVIEIGHDRLQLVGLDDAYTGHSDIDKAVKGLNHHLPTLGLSHIAEEADRLWFEGVPLVLSGHTHAGQITVARLHELAVGRLAGHKYVHGLYGDRKAHGAVYVGAGIGAAVMPLRFGERGQREVAIFELGHLPGAIEEHHQEQPALPGRKPTAKTQRKRKEAVAKKAERRAKREKKKPEDAR